MRRGTGCVRRREAFGWGPYPIKATEGRATEGEAGSRATSFGRGKAAECVVEPDAFVDAKHLDGAPPPSRPPRAALQRSASKGEVQKAAGEGGLQRSAGKGRGTEGRPPRAALQIAASGREVE